VRLFDKAERVFHLPDSESRPICLVLFGLLVAVAVISILIWWLSNNSDL
jgi:hypothetical protein